MERVIQQQDARVVQMATELVAQLKALSDEEAAATLVQAIAGIKQDVRTQAMAAVDVVFDGYPVKCKLVHQMLEWMELSDEQIEHEIQLRHRMFGGG